jgi:hypothetical protein
MNNDRLLIEARKQTEYIRQINFVVQALGLLILVTLLLGCCGIGYVFVTFFSTPR